MKYTNRNLFLKTKTIALNIKKKRIITRALNDVRLGKKKEEVPRVTDLFFKSFSTDSNTELFLLDELVRYIEELLPDSNEQVLDFIQFNKFCRLNNLTSEEIITKVFNRPIACLNPEESNIKSLKLQQIDLIIRTWASIKENGYRMQAHSSKDNLIAYSRQFNRYDLRLFPELFRAFQLLPVLIGDVELINKKYTHFNGFYKVQDRLPGTKYWPEAGKTQIEESLYQKLLANRNIFGENGMPLEDYRCMPLFHGLYAIAHPDTWELPKAEQEKHLISLMKLPIDYALIVDILKKLEAFMLKHSIDARIMNIQEINTKEELNLLWKLVLKKNLEGLCITQTASNTEGIVTFEKSKKIKLYHEIDMTLLGVYFHKPKEKATAENIKAALLGIYDARYDRYLPALRVNLNPDGVQVSDEVKSERVREVRQQIFELLPETKSSQLTTLADLYFIDLQKMLDTANFEMIEAEELISDLPIIQNLKGENPFVFMYEQYQKNTLKYHHKLKLKLKYEEFIAKYAKFFQGLALLNKVKRQKLLKLLGQAKEIQRKSQNLEYPDFIINPGENIQKLIFLEAKVFEIKEKLNPMPAGFEPDLCRSLYLHNAYITRLRPDKGSTDNLQKIRRIAKANSEGN